jgi:hypothetical protein
MKWLRRQVYEGKAPTVPVGPRVLLDPKKVAKAIQDHAGRLTVWGEYPQSEQPRRR